MEYTDEQIAIFEHVGAGKGDLLIDALAGTGKTFSLLESLAVIPQKSILFTAFNKRIAEALQARLPKLASGTVVHVKTFHAQGYAILKSKYRHLGGKDCVTGDSTEELINETAEGAAYPVRRAAVRLLRALKEVTFTEDITRAEVVRFGHDEALFENRGSPMPDIQVNQTADIVGRAYRNGMDFMSRKTIDFVDMIWGPLVRNIAPPSRYQAVIVDELQDVNKPQLALISRLIVPGGRLIGCGDRNQAIYAFRKAIPAEVWAMFKQRGAKSLPLTITFRCARAIVAEANELVPELRPRANAPAGSVVTMDKAKMVSVLKSPAHRPDTFVLSRNNADLLTCALLLWRSGVRFQLNAGKEMLEPLYAILDHLPTSGTTAGFLAALTTWYQSENARAEAANATAWAERLEEQYKMLGVAAAHTTPGKIRGLLGDLIAENDSGVLLSTVHKVKGLEASRVFLLRDTFERHKPREWPDGRAKPDIEEEELNCEYVGITRAKSELIWVSLS